MDDPGLCLAPPIICRGANSGFQALNLAVHLGARRIVLLGYDMQRTGGLSHWHGDHGRGLNNPSEHNFARWRRQFEEAAPTLAAAGIEVVNCSRATALTCFPRMDLHAALC